jgi:hypothetical protein
MIATPNLDEILGAEVVDPNNDTVGKVGRIYLDSDRDVPTWVSVRTGLFGLSETLVPVDDATWEGQVLHVTVDKARIKDAPRVDVDQEIAPQDQERLYSYYERSFEGTGGAGGADYGSSSSGYGGADQGRDDRSMDHSSDSAGAGGMGAAGMGAAGAGAAGIGAGRHAHDADSRRSGLRGSTSRGDEPLGGGNHNPAAFEVDEDQRLREAGRSAGDGQLGGGSQNPSLLEGREEFGDDSGELGGGNQNPALYERREDRSIDEGDLGGGNQNPGGYNRHSGVGAPTHGGPGEFTGPRAGGVDARRSAAAQDDPGRMRLADGETGDQQGGGMRMSGDGPGGMRGSGDAMGDQPGDATGASATGMGGAMGGEGATGASGSQGVRSPGGRGMRLRRYVVTEQQTVTMPVTREEFRLEPEDEEGRDQTR